MKTTTMKKIRKEKKEEDGYSSICYRINSYVQFSITITNCKFCSLLLLFIKKRIEILIIRQLEKKSVKNRT